MSSLERYREFRRACWQDRARANQMIAEDRTILNARSGLGETVLHDIAVENGLDAVRFLINEGANPDPRNDFDQSPLQECASICAEQHNLIAILELLLRAGADPYHHTLTLPCAWHLAERSTFEPLQALFSSIAAPAARHEDCELFAPLAEEAE